MKMGILRAPGDLRILVSLYADVSDSPKKMDRYRIEDLERPIEALTGLMFAGGSEEDRCRSW
jgi:hypothetical protein